MACHKKVEFGGKIWNLSALARLFGLKRATLYMRIYRGMTLMEALNTPLYPGQPTVVNDRQMNQTQIAKLLGVHRSIFYARKQRGLPDDAIYQPKRQPRLVTAWNRTQSISEWSREKNIDRATLRWRLNSGLPPEVALTLTVDETKSRAQKKIDSGTQA